MISSSLEKGFLNKLKIANEVVKEIVITFTFQIRDHCYENF